MEILIFGAGAVGLGMGSALLAADCGVKLVARPASVEALRREGLVRTGFFGSHRAAPESFSAASSMAELPQEPVDVALVATKSFDSEAAARALAQQPALVGPETRVVLFQNGWGNAERFLPHFPEERVWNARVITGFRRIAPNQVDITVHAEPVHVGSLFGCDPAPLSALCSAISRGGIPCEITAHIAEDLWAKLLYNGLLNPLGAILDVPYGELGVRAETRETMHALAHEIFAVMEAAGYETHWPDAESYLADFYERLLPPTARHESSTLQDLRAGKRTEMDALTGAVVRLGEAHGVPVPVNRTLLAQVRFIEARRRREP